MAGPLRIQADEYRRFFAATKAASGKIRTRARKRIRDTAKTMAPGLVQEGADAMPSRGGLAEHVASKGRNPTVSLTATGARLVLGKKKGPQIGRMNEGNLRHPLYGNRKVWLPQPVPAGSWTEAAEKRLPKLRDEVAREINQVMKELG